jgi:hypothetical protein
MDSIKEITKKIKHFYTSVPYEFLVSVAIILVGLSAFALGRLSVLTEKEVEPVVKYNTTLSNEPLIHMQGSVLVSKSGTKYHYPWCSGAQRIKPENIRWYDTIEMARTAGYTPASNCKGLE